MEEQKMETNQIAVLKTSDRLIAFYDQLKPAGAENYAAIHANGEKRDGRKVTSLIGIKLFNYANGTGDRTVKVKYNIAPEDLQFLLTRVEAGFQEYEYNDMKIWPDADQNGYSTVTKISITRHQFSQNGSPMQRPWYFKIENGKGKRSMRQNGSAWLEPGSYRQNEAVSVFLNMEDKEIYKLLKRVDAYITAWEAYTAPSLITEGMKLQNGRGAHQPGYNQYGAYQNAGFQNANQNQNNQYAPSQNGFPDYQQNQFYSYGQEGFSGQY